MNNTIPYLLDECPVATKSTLTFKMLRPLSATYTSSPFQTDVIYMKHPRIPSLESRHPFLKNVNSHRWNHPRPIYYSQVQDTQSRESVLGKCRGDIVPVLRWLCHPVLRGCQG